MLLSFVHISEWCCQYCCSWSFVHSSTSHQKRLTGFMTGSMLVRSPSSIARCLDLQPTFCFHAVLGHWQLLPFACENPNSKYLGSDCHHPALWIACRMYGDVAHIVVWIAACSCWHSVVLAKRSRAYTASTLNVLMNGPRVMISDHCESGQGSDRGSDTISCTECDCMANENWLTSWKCDKYHGKPQPLLAL